MKKIIISLILLIICSLSWAENTKGLGVALGPVSAGGISFRKIADDTGHEFNYIGFGNNSSFTIVLGGKYLKLINSTESSRFYYFGGASALIEFSKNSEEDLFLNFGAGIGFEFSLREHLRVSFDLPLSFINVLPAESNDTIISIAIPEIGIRYHF